MLLALPLGLFIAPLEEWARSVPDEEWPRQAGQMHGPEFRDAHPVLQPFVEQILHHKGPSHTGIHYFSYLRPGQSIAKHSDMPLPHRICRVHVPILTNPDAYLALGDQHFYLKPGFAYEFDPTQAHSVHNPGATPRLHWIFDVLSS